MPEKYVHGYDPRENRRLQDQASTLVELLHSDTAYPEGSRVLEAGCGVGAQTVTLAANSPKALVTSIDVAEASLSAASKAVAAAGIANVTFRQADIFRLPFPPGSFDHAHAQRSSVRMRVTRQSPAAAAGRRCGCRSP